MRLRFALAVALLLCLSAAFALMAYWAPVKAVPPSPVCGVSDSAACITRLAAYNSIITFETAVGGSVWAYWSYADLAEGFAAAATLFLVASLIKAPAFLRRSVTSPRAVRAALGVVAACGFGIFIYEEFFNILFAYTHWSLAIHLFNAFIGHSYWSPLIAGGSTGAASEFAFSALVAASVAVGLLRARFGLFEGFRSCVLAFTAVATASQLALLLFDVKEMEFHVTSFVTWSLGGVYLLSNWTVLVASGSLFALAVLRRRAPA